MPDEDSKKLNPQITDVTIGVRELRNIKIYPLSVGDQLSMTSVIGEAINAISDVFDEVELAGATLRLIQSNLPMVLGFVTDTDTEIVEDLLKDITNEQAISISEIVYEQNYKSLAKKVKGLLEKVKKEMEELPSRRPSQPSVNTTDTDLMISTENDSKTGASQ